MPVLKKTAQMLKRSMHLLVFINLVFAATTFSMLYFAGKKIQSYVLVIYAYAPQLQDLQSVLSENVSLADLNQLNQALAVINQAYRMVFIITIASLIVFFLLWCFFQSLEWMITCKSLKKAVKLENLFDGYLKYSLKFSLATIPAFIIILPTSYYLIANLKTLFLNLLVKMYSMEAQATNPYMLSTALLAVFLVATYLTVILYILLNKYKLVEAVKKTFKVGVKKVHVLLPIHFICLSMIAPIIYLDSYLIKFLNFKASAILSLLIYFVIIAFYQALAVVLLEKE